MSAEVLQRLFAETPADHTPGDDGSRPATTIAREVTRLLPLRALIRAPGAQVHFLVLEAYADTLLAEAHDRVSFARSLHPPPTASQDPRVLSILDNVARSLGHRDYATHLDSSPAVGPLLSAAAKPSLFQL